MLIDIVFAVLMLLAVFKGVTKGFIVAVFSFVAFFVGLAAALKLSATVAGYLSAGAITGRWLPFVSFAIVFIGVIFLVKWGAAIIKRTVSLVLLGWLDRLGGVLLFAIIYLMIYSIVLFYASQLHLVTPQLLAESATGNFIMPWGPKAISLLSAIVPWFSNMFTELGNFFEDAAPGATERVGN